MKKLIATLFIAGTLAGCSTQQKPQSLNTLNERYENLSHSETVQQHAKDQLSDTESQIASAEDTWEDEGAGVQYDHSYYLATRSADITEKTAEAGDLQSQLDAAKAKEQQLNAALQMKSATGNNSELANVKDILFEFDEAELDKAAEEKLKQVVAYLKEHSETDVVIAGHADATGDADYNLNLSEKRANSVAQKLSSLGIPQDRIRIKAFGERQPIATNDTPKGRKFNRRAEVTVP